MASIVVTGDTSGSITLSAPAVAGSNTLTLPANTGTVLTTASSGQSIPKAALPTGSVLQVVSVEKADIFTTTSTSYVDVTGLSASITPTSSSSKILILLNITCGTSASDAFFNLLRGSTNIAQGTGGSTSNQTFMINGTSPVGNGMLVTNINYLDSPATTSSTTYKVQTKTVSGTTVRISARGVDNVFGGTSSITLLEIAA